MNNKKTKRLSWILTPILILVMNVYYKVENIPSTIFVREGESISSTLLLKIKEEKNKINICKTTKKNLDKKLEVSLLGVLPIKSVDVKVVPPLTVNLGGQPIGIKLNIKGVLVVALSDFQGERGKESSPAANAGIQLGDSILKINNLEVNTAEAVATEINRCDGKEVTVLIERKGSEIEKKVLPIKSAADNTYKIGLWIRDSTAGVGTLTFYENKSGKIAALGHPITDVDTGVILRISSGQMVNSSIVSIKKGIKGNPGELRGIFVDQNNIIGEIHKNTECGIFANGKIDSKNNEQNKSIEVALRNEIKEGPAKILTTIEGETPKFYDIEIQKLLFQETPGPKSMIIKVTDPILLQKTGGIVQGMSGSPIVQNNKLIGAVTHVLINKPDVGYGIYIEWMLKDADILYK